MLPEAKRHQVRSLDSGSVLVSLIELSILEATLSLKSSVFLKRVPRALKALIQKKHYIIKPFHFVSAVALFVSGF